MGEILGGDGQSRRLCVLGVVWEIFLVSEGGMGYMYLGGDE